MNRGSKVAPLIDEVCERVEAVEEEVRSHFTSEAFELRLQPCLFQARAAQSIALPVAQQEHGFVDVGDGDHERNNREESSGQRLLACAEIAGHPRQIHRSAAATGIVYRQMTASSGRAGARGAAANPRAAAAGSTADDCLPRSGTRPREPDIGGDQPARGMPRMIDQPRQIGTRAPRNWAGQESRPEIMNLARVQSPPA